jgi:hypothetical protein
MRAGMDRLRRSARRLGTVLVLAALLLGPLAASGHWYSHHDAPECATCVALHARAEASAPGMLPWVAVRAVAFAAIAPEAPAERARIARSGRAPPHVLPALVA